VPFGIEAVAPDIADRGSQFSLQFD